MIPGERRTIGQSSSRRSSRDVACMEFPGNSLRDSGVVRHRGRLMQHLAFPQRSRQDMVEGVAPVGDVVMGVDEDVGWNVKSRQGMVEPTNSLWRLRPGPNGSASTTIRSTSELSRSSPRPREPNRITCSGSTSSTMAWTMRSRSASVTGSIGSSAQISIPRRPQASGSRTSRKSNLRKSRSWV